MTCTVEIWTNYGDLVCGELAVAAIQTGCVHEHIEQNWACRRHTEVPLCCSQCRDAGHMCNVERLVPA